MMMMIMWHVPRRSQRAHLQKNATFSSLSLSFSHTQRTVIELSSCVIFNIAIIIKKRTLPGKKISRRATSSPLYKDMIQNAIIFFLAITFVNSYVSCLMHFALLFWLCNKMLSRIATCIVFIKKIHFFR